MGTGKSRRTFGPTENRWPRLLADSLFDKGDARGTSLLDHRVVVLAGRHGQKPGGRALSLKKGLKALGFRDFANTVILGMKQKRRAADAADMGQGGALAEKIGQPV